MKCNISSLIPILLCLFLSSCVIRPEPVTREDVAQIIAIDRQLTLESQEPLISPPDLYEAMARALKYNLESRVRLVEEAVASGNFDLARSDMLPMLSASMSYQDRNNVDASRSISVLTHRESLEPSTSQERARDLSEIRFNWSVIDFGVSYLKAKQEADRFIMAQNIRRKLMLNLLQQVRTSYWRAVAMESMKVELDSIENQVNNALDDLNKVRTEQLKTPVSTLNEIRALLETRQQLQDVKQSVNNAHMQLATLMNLTPDSQIGVKIPEMLTSPGDIADELEDLEMQALLNSNDYANQIYGVRIDQLETRKALLRILPGLEFSYGRNYDSNRFLYTDQWGELRIRLTGNIMRLFYLDRIKALRESSEELALNRRMAFNMAVITSVHLAWQDYVNALARLEHARSLDKLDRDIAQYSQDAMSARSGTRAKAIQDEFRSFRSRMASLLTYADTQMALGEFLVTVGVNPVPATYQELGVDELADVLRDAFDDAEKTFTKASQAPLVSNQPRVDQATETGVEIPEVEADTWSGLVSAAAATLDTPDRSSTRALQRKALFLW